MGKLILGLVQKLGLIVVKEVRKINIVLKAKKPKARKPIFLMES